MRQVRRVSLAAWPISYLPAAAADDIDLSSRPYRHMHLLTGQAADAAPLVVSCMRAEALAPSTDVPYRLPLGAMVSARTSRMSRCCSKVRRLWNNASVCALGSSASAMGRSFSSCPWSVRRDAARAALKPFFIRSVAPACRSTSTTAVGMPGLACWCSGSFPCDAQKLDRLIFPHDTLPDRC